MQEYASIMVRFTIILKLWTCLSRNKHWHSPTWKACSKSLFSNYGCVGTAVLPQNFAHLSCLILNRFHSFLMNKCSFECISRPCRLMHWYTILWPAVSLNIHQVSHGKRFFSQYCPLDMSRKGQNSWRFFIATTNL